MAKITNEADLFTDGDFGFILLPTLLHPCGYSVPHLRLIVISKVFCFHRASTGQIRLKSSNPFAAPRIDPMYYSNETDFATMTRGIKEVRRLAEASALSKFARPGCWPTHHRDIAKSLDVNSDEYIQQIMRLSTKTLYHPMGTAKMGPPEDPLAVVSPQLEVFGTKGLRVVDLSITPSVCLAYLWILHWFQLILTG
jgi:choline dehydrogenase-like flavoprotein